MIIFEKGYFLTCILKILQQLSQILSDFNDFRCVLKLEYMVIMCKKIERLKPVSSGFYQFFLSCFICKNCNWDFKKTGCSQVVGPVFSGCYNQALKHYKIVIFLCYSMVLNTFNQSISEYTVQGQGQALLAPGLAWPDPKRARVGPEFWWSGLALMGSRANKA